MYSVYEQRLLDIWDNSIGKRLLQCHDWSCTTKGCEIMVDMSLCNGKGCKMLGTCYRYLSLPCADPLHQSFINSFDCIEHDYVAYCEDD